MKTKKILALIMTIAMAVCMTVVFTACGEEEAQETEQTEATEATEAETTTEDPSEVAKTVDDYVALAGEYEDETSQRASATIVANTESRILNITVVWGSSATETTQWTMNAEKDGNLLKYSDCVRTDMIYSDETDDPEAAGEETGGGAEETVVYENGQGSFEITDDGKLLWNGAQDEDCVDCVFVRIASE